MGDQHFREHINMTSGGLRQLRDKGWSELVVLVIESRKVVNFEQENPSGTYVPHSRLVS